MSELVGNPEDRFSQNEAHLKVDWDRAESADGKILKYSSIPYIVLLLLLLFSFQ